MRNSCTEETERRVINTASNNYKTLLSTSQGPREGRRDGKVGRLSARLQREDVAVVKSGGGAETRKRRNRLGLEMGVPFFLVEIARIFMMMMMFFLKKTMVQWAKGRGDNTERGVLPSRRAPPYSSTCLQRAGWGGISFISWPQANTASTSPT